MDILLSVLDAQGLVPLLEFVFSKILKAFGGVVGEDDVCCFCLYMSVSI